MVDGKSVNLFGRRQIFTSENVIDRGNLISILDDALIIHCRNSNEIQYLFRYLRGAQPILEREKKIRPEICNKIVENHALEIASFTSGYFLGEPCTYVRRGDREGASENINDLNDLMFLEDKASDDKELANWLVIGGVAYRMVLPNNRYDKDLVDDSPIKIDVLDPRFTFVVYHTGFGHRRMLGAVRMKRKVNGEEKIITCGYTDSYYFEVEDGQISKWEPHTMGDIPIFEYKLNMSSMGSFEPVLSLMNAINTIASNRVDGIEQFIQAFMKFINCDIDEPTFQALADMGCIKIKSIDGAQADVEVVSQELNQEQTQTLVDYLYQQILIICGVPTTTKGGSSTSDTGAAVFLRDGWTQAEERAKDTELLFKKSEKQFLKLVLSIMRTMVGTNLKLSEIDYKFTRRQTDGLLTKSQSLLHMLQAGLNPEVAIATSGLFNDPADVASRSAQTMKKWDYLPPTSDPPVDDSGSSETDSTKTQKGDNLTKTENGAE